MKQNRKIALTAAACILTAALAGCGSSAVTDEVIVEPNETQTTQASAAPSGTDIAAQVQAPGTWQTEFADEQAHIQVSVDAAVTVPQAEGFRLKDVTARAFEKGDYEAVNSVLFGGAKLWDRDVAPDDPAHGFTRQEIEERIEALEERKASGVEYDEAYGDGNINFDEKIAEFRAMLEAAPDEVKLKDIDTDAFFAGGHDTEEGAFLSGNVTAGEREYFISLTNDMRENWKWVIFEGRLDGNSFYPVSQYMMEQEKGWQTPEDEFIKAAEKAVTDMGLKDFAPAGGEIFGTFEESIDEVKMGKSAYGVHFERVVDGIPVTYTSKDGTAVEGEEDVAWPYENLWLAYDDGGLVNFYWTDPYVLEDRSNEYVFLMPFEEIQNIFREMLVKKYSKHTENGADMAFQIKDIRLGYMRVLDRENPGKGTLIPVWDFFGSQTYTLKDTVEELDGKAQVVDGPYDSWLTINAMDGTVIDRDFGY